VVLLEEVPYVSVVVVDEELNVLVDVLPVVLVVE